jgi:DNA (cytosine-5)-methyltransferase 1
MSYLTHLHSVLATNTTINKPLVLDLFAGCGGLALGFEAAGFETYGLEKNIDCCSTYQKNLKGKCVQTVITPTTEFPMASVVIGGPPCQPFSVGGNQLGLQDARDGFPAFIAAIAKIKPDIWLFENVRGLLYRNKWYLDQVTTALRSLGYIIETYLLNMVNYGVPQNRERLVVIGHKGKYNLPKLLDYVTSAGDALGDLVTAIPSNPKFLTPSMDEYVAKYEKASFCKRPRDLHLDLPSRTLTCRNLAGATGDMMRLKMSDGRRRRLTTREAARLQSFPDWFDFVGTETSCFNQIGNAVPPLFAYYLALSVRSYLESTYRVANTETEAFLSDQPAKFENLTLW